MKKLLITLVILCSGFAAVCQKNLPQILRLDKVTVVRDDVDVAPAFPGGSRGWTNFVHNNLNGGIAEANNAPPGTYYIVVDFVVDTEGQPKSIRPLTHYGYGMEREAIRVIKLSSWKPGTIKGKPVNAMKNVVISFVVTHKPISI